MSRLGGCISWGFLSGKHYPPVVKSPAKVLPPAQAGFIGQPIGLLFLLTWAS